MGYSPLRDICPELSRQQMRTFTVAQDDELPAGRYGLVERFCDFHWCDCRVVLLDVISPDVRWTWKPSVPLATVNFGWENEAFYRRWVGGDVPMEAEELAEMRGPALVRWASQSPYAPALLAHVRAQLQDPAYVERIRQHYRLFREANQFGEGACVGRDASWLLHQRQHRRRERIEARRRRARRSWMRAARRRRGERRGGKGQGK